MNLCRTLQKEELEEFEACGQVCRVYADSALQYQCKDGTWLSFYRASDILSIYLNLKTFQTLPTIFRLPIGTEMPVGWYIYKIVDDNLLKVQRTSGAWVYVTDPETIIKVYERIRG